jgi:catechol 2,3-dioxygenase-like lactoylglutathione lyase family enzyme
MHLDTPILFAATTDARRARDFYERVLGLEFLSEDPFALVFAVGEVMLRIQLVTQKPVVPYTVLGWRVQDIDGEIARLTRAGVQFARYPGLEQSVEGIWQSPAGSKIAWFEDPDGNILALAQME